MTELHVTNGDAAAAAIAARLRGTVPLAWRDVLHEGPVPALGAAELRAVRATFLAEAGWARADGARIDLEQRDRRLAAIDHSTRVNLWFEDDLYDQLQLLQILERLIDHNGPIFLIALPRPPRGDLLIPYGYARPVSESQLELGARGWRAFTGPDPEVVQELALVGTPGLPDLAPALLRLLQEHPWTTDGLGLTARMLLRAVVAGASTPEAAFAAATTLEARPFLGDTVAFRRLDLLAAGARPLIVRSEDGVLAPTADAEAVLAGRADAVALAGGIDRWVGGVHHQGSDAQWRWDPTVQRVRQTMR